MYKTILAALGAVVLGASASWAAETRYDFEFTLGPSLSPEMTNYGYIGGQTYAGQFYFDDSTVSFDGTQNQDTWAVSVDFFDDPGGTGVVTGYVAAFELSTDIWSLIFDLSGTGSLVSLSVSGDFGYFDGLFNTPADRPFVAPPDLSNVTASEVSIRLDYDTIYFAREGFAPPTEVMADVPLPVSAPLLASGLFAIGWASRRRKVA